MPDVTYDKALDTFECATEENTIDPLRDQQVINLPAEGELWVAGDLHDHRRNFEKIIRLADLGRHPNRHLLLQEVIHGDFFDANGAEESWPTLLRAAELKCDYSEQVHFILANHDLAQIQGKGITKGNVSVCEAFNKGVKKAFGEKYGRVQAAISDFLLSFPLAVRAPNGLFFCHSIPAEDQLEAFDYGVFSRPLTGSDYARRTGAAYQLIWGRNTGPDQVAKFADQLNASIVITGHQPQESGFKVNGPRHLIIASDHNQGVFLHVDLSTTYDMDRLVGRLRKFVSIDLDALPAHSAPEERSEAIEIAEPTASSDTAPAVEPAEQQPESPDDLAPAEATTLEASSPDVSSTDASSESTEATPSLVMRLDPDGTPEPYALVQL